MDMNWQKMAIAAGVLFAAYKFAPNSLIKGGVLSVAAVVVAKQLPYVKEYV